MAGENGDGKAAVSLTVARDVGERLERDPAYRAQFCRDLAAILGCPPDEVDIAQIQHVNTDRGESGAASRIGPRGPQTPRGPQAL